MNDQVASQNPDSEDRRSAVAKRQPEEEVELWWGSYAPRTVLPDVALCLLLTIMVIGLASYLGAWHEEIVVRSSIRALLITFWILQAAKWCYRLTAISYRLTTKRLLSTRDFSLHAPPEQGLLLEHVGQVLVEQRFLERLLKVGRIHVMKAAGSPPDVVLSGIFQPMRIAAMIRRQLKKLPHSQGKTP